MPRGNRKGKRRGRRARGRGRRGGGLIHTPKRTAIETGKTVTLVRRNLKRLLRIPRNVFMTENVIVDFTFPDTTLTRVNAGFTYLSWRYRMNSIYDPDPALGSGSVPGYSAWSTFFNNYRVLSASYSIDISNLETSPVDVFVCPTILDLGLNYPSANELFGNPHCAQSLISAKGGADRTRLKGFIDLGNFVGNTSQYIGDDGYGGSFGANPGVTLFLNIGGISAATFTALNGLDYRFTLTMTTLLYGRKIVIN
jgi:hypothetical protein